MSCCSLCDAEELLKLAFNLDQAKSRWRMCVILRMTSKFEPLFIYFLLDTLATWTQLVFFRKTVFEDNPGFACSPQFRPLMWMEGGENIFEAAQHAFQIPVIHLSLCFNKQCNSFFPFFFSLMCVIRSLWGKSFSSTFPTSVCHQVDFIYRAPFKKKKNVWIIWFSTTPTCRNFNVAVTIFT